MADELLAVHVRLVVVVAEDGCPRYAPLDDLASELGKNAFRVPTRALSVELIAGENDEVGFLRVEHAGDEGRRQIVGVLAGRERCVTANATCDREVQVGNLQDLELAVPREV